MCQPSASLTSRAPVIRFWAPACLPTGRSLAHRNRTRPTATGARPSGCAGPPGRPAGARRSECARPLCACRSVGVEVRRAVRRGLARRRRAAELPWPGLRFMRGGERTGTSRHPEAESARPAGGINPGCFGCMRPNRVSGPWCTGNRCKTGAALATVNGKSGSTPAGSHWAARGDPHRPGRRSQGISTREPGDRPGRVVHPRGAGEVSRSCI